MVDLFAEMSSFVDGISPDKKLMELSYSKFLLGGQKRHDYYLI